MGVFHAQHRCIWPFVVGNVRNDLFHWGLECQIREQHAVPKLHRELLSLRINFDISVDFVIGSLSTYDLSLLSISQSIHFLSTRNNPMQKRQFLNQSSIIWQRSSPPFFCLSVSWCDTRAPAFKTFPKALICLAIVERQNSLVLPVVPAFEHHIHRAMLAISRLQTCLVVSRVFLSSQ